MIASAIFLKCALLFVVFVFAIGVAAIFLRRVAVWSLVGQITSLKAVAAAAFILSRLPLEARADLESISLLVAAMVPAAAFVGLVVLHRCGRFGASLDYEKQDELRG